MTGGLCLCGATSLRGAASVGLRFCAAASLGLRLTGATFLWGCVCVWGYVSEGLRMTGGCLLCGAVSLCGQPWVILICAN